MEWSALPDQKNNLSKIENNIAELLENKRFIKASNTSFSVYELNQKKPIHSGLNGSETLSMQYGNEIITLNDVNKERYEPDVPKLLVDNKTQDVYLFPQYEKVFPKKITKATTSQIDFIKKTSLVYSITNSLIFCWVFSITIMMSGRMTGFISTPKGRLQTPLVLITLKFWIRSGIWSGPTGK